MAEKNSYPTPTLLTEQTVGSSGNEPRPLFIYDCNVRRLFRCDERDYVSLSLPEFKLPQCLRSFSRTLKSQLRFC